MAVPNLQIAVVGGSIAGCCAAVELTRAGHHVEVFERSPSAVVGQGAGIGLLPPTLDWLIGRDLVDANMPRVSVREHVFAAKTPASPRMGRQARLPMSSMSLNWADLHANLRKRVPEGAYHMGVEVCAIESASDGTTLVFADGVRRSFDLAVFADGYASLGRRFICPEVEPSYRGHVLWRGVLDISQLSDPAPLDASVYRLSYRGLPAHAMVYRIPAGDASAADGGGLANVGCYVPVSSEALADLLIDRAGRRHAASLAAGEVRAEEQARFKAYVREALPDFFDELISLCDRMFVQAIFTLRAPRHRSARVCSIGDAGTLIPPVTGSGILKATHHAIKLASALCENADIDVALASWDQHQTAFGDVLFRLGERMEQALIWNMVDLSELDEPMTVKWWQATTSLS